MVLGEVHPEFKEGKEAAQANSAELFETQLFANASGVALEKLSGVHSHYFGCGFEKAVGKKLRQFINELYEVDEKTGRVLAPAKMLNALRRKEAAGLIAEEKEYAYQKKEEDWKKHKEELKRQKNLRDADDEDPDAKRARTGPPGGMPA